MRSGALSPPETVVARHGSYRNERPTRNNDNRRHVYSVMTGTSPLPSQSIGSSRPRGKEEVSVGRRGSVQDQGDSTKVRVGDAGSR